MPRGGVLPPSPPLNAALDTEYGSQECLIAIVARFLPCMNAQVVVFSGHICVPYLCAGAYCLCQIMTNIGSLQVTYKMKAPRVLMPRWMSKLHNIKYTSY